MYSTIKRILDLTAAIILIIILSPVYIFTSILIYSENRGKIIYKQIRTGINGNTFTIFKFRTMHENAEPDGPVWAGINDGRITRTGKILRDLGIDEIPQLFNVIKNDMSLIGPRPERPHFTDKFAKLIHGYSVRHCVKPGITGLSQIYYGSDQSIEDVKRKLRMDLLYIRKKSFKLDNYILFLTIKHVSAKIISHVISPKKINSYYEGEIE